MRIGRTRTSTATLPERRPYTRSHPTRSLSLSWALRRLPGAGGAPDAPSVAGPTGERRRAAPGKLGAAPLGRPSVSESLEARADSCAAARLPAGELWLQVELGIGRVVRAPARVGSICVRLGLLGCRAAESWRRFRCWTSAPLPRSTAVHRRLDFGFGGLAPWPALSLWGCPPGPLSLVLSLDHNWSPPCVAWAGHRGAVGTEHMRTRSRLSSRAALRVGAQSRRASGSRCVCGGLALEARQAPANPTLGLAGR